MLSYVVQQRTREIGIRGVLGAGAADILGMVLSQAMRLSIVGIVVGLITAVGTMRLMQGLLYGTPTRDVAVYAAVSTIASRGGTRREPGSGAPRRARRPGDRAAG